MLPYVPTVFAVYRPIARHLRWTLQCLVGFADTTGKCFPSVRKLAEEAELSKSTVSRHLSELAKLGAISRHRRPGGVYTYRIDARFLPASWVSHARAATVPRAKREEYPWNKISDSVGELTDVPWVQRIRGWQKTGFWLDQWGSKPTESGCIVPVAILGATIGHDRRPTDR